MLLAGGFLPTTTEGDTRMKRAENTIRSEKAQGKKDKKEENTSL